MDGIKRELTKPAEASTFVDGKAVRGGPLRNINAPHDNRVMWAWSMRPMKRPWLGPWTRLPSCTDLARARRYGARRNS